jgi:hypothetical protein
MNFFYFFIFFRQVGRLKIRTVGGQMWVKII